MLTFDNISYTYHTKEGETTAVKDLTFTVDNGQFVSVIGPSGCGKTTILSLAAGILSPTSGEVVRDNGEFGYMLQRDALFPWRTVEQNIFLPLEVKKRNTPQMREKAVSLIRTLAAEPDILLLDEPFSALDYQTRLEVCDDVQSIIKSEKKTALLVTHDISEAIALSDKVVVLSTRPARVVAEHLIEFGGSSPKRRRECSEFAATFEVLRKELGI